MVVIGEASTETEEVFKNKAKETSAPITLAYNNPLVSDIKENPSWGWDCSSPVAGNIHLPLAGDYQQKNLNTVLNAISLFPSVGIDINREDIINGLKNVDKLTGLRGRWMRLSEKPLVICDTGHNQDGLRYNLSQLKRIYNRRSDTSRLRMIIGFVADKDVDHILPLFPKDAEYYLTNAAIPRALKVEELQSKCEIAGIKGNSYRSVAEAYKAAMSESSPEDVVYVGGSTFIVADLLAAIDNYIL